MKVLSIAIPAYNVERYLARCLDSLLYDSTIYNDLDIIVVNDGSRDDTIKIAEEYSRKYKCIRIIDKENGGHGSTINSAIKIAKGKYFKVIDSDDWVNIFDFAKFVNSLKKETADIVVTNYKKDILYNTKTEEFVFCIEDSKLFDISRIKDDIREDDFFFKFSMHSMTLKTEALKSVWREGLLEKTFYVDQQFVALSLLGSKSYRLLNYDIYRYFIGRPDQSMNPESFFKHRLDHERVLKWLLMLDHSHSADKKEYFKVVLSKQISLMLRTHYMIYRSKYKTSQSNKELRSFDRFIKQNYPEIKLPKSSGASIKNLVHRGVSK